MDKKIDDDMEVKSETSGGSKGSKDMDNEWALFSCIGVSGDCIGALLPHPTSRS